MYTSTAFLKMTPATMATGNCCIDTSVNQIIFYSAAQSESTRLIEELAEELKTEISSPIQTPSSEEADDPMVREFPHPTPLFVYP
jgi:hypothetical protein